MKTVEELEAEVERLRREREILLGELAWREIAIDSLRDDGKMTFAGAIAQAIERLEAPRSRIDLRSVREALAEHDRPVGGDAMEGRRRFVCPHCGLAQEKTWPIEHNNYCNRCEREMDTPRTEAFIDAVFQHLMREGPESFRVYFQAEMELAKARMELHDPITGQRYEVVVRPIDGGAEDRPRPGGVAHEA